MIIKMIQELGRKMDAQCKKLFNRESTIIKNSLPGMKNAINEKSWIQRHELKKEDRVVEISDRKKRNNLSN